MYIYSCCAINLKRFYLGSKGDCYKEVLAIRRIFSLVDMITNTKFSNCPSIFKMGVESARFYGIVNGESL